MLWCIMLGMVQTFTIPQLGDVIMESSDRGQLTFIVLKDDVEYVSDHILQPLILFSMISPRLFDRVAAMRAKKWDCVFKPSEIGLKLFLYDLHVYDGNIFIVFAYENVQYAIVVVYDSLTSITWFTRELTFDEILVKAGMSLHDFIATVKIGELNDEIFVKVYGQDLISTRTDPIHLYLRDYLYVHPSLIMDMSDLFPSPHRP